VEYVDHLHEHFVDPANVQSGRYLAPRAPGYSTTIKPASLARYEYPAGHAWRTGGNAKSVDGRHDD
jgi:L-fuconate dehydratase